MKKFIALFLVISFLGMNCATIRHPEPSQKRGSTLIIQTIDMRSIKGELIAVKEDSLLLLNTEGADSSINISNIKTIKIVKKSKAVLGILMGGSLGALIATVAYEDTGGGIPVGGAFHVAGAAILGLLIGGIGAVAAGKDKTIQIEGKSAIGIRNILNYLRKKARVPDFQ